MLNAYNIQHKHTINADQAFYTIRSKFALEALRTCCFNSYFDSLADTNRFTEELRKITEQVLVFFTVPEDYYDESLFQELADITGNKVCISELNKNTIGVINEFKSSSDYKSKLTIHFLGLPLMKFQDYVFTVTNQNVFELNISVDSTMHELDKFPFPVHLLNKEEEDLGGTKTVFLSGYEVIVKDNKITGGYRDINPWFVLFIALVAAIVVYLISRICNQCMYRQCSHRCMQNNCLPEFCLPEFCLSEFCLPEFCLSELLIFAIAWIVNIVPKDRMNKCLYISN